MTMEEQLARLISDERQHKAEAGFRNHQLTQAADEQHAHDLASAHSQPVGVRRQVGRRIMRLGAWIADDRRGELTPIQR